MTSAPWTTALWTTAVLPAVLGVGLCLLGRRADRAAPWVGSLAATAVLALAAGDALGRATAGAPFLPGLRWEMEVDLLAAVVLPTVAAVALLVLVFSTGDVHGARARFTGLMLLFEAAVVVTVCAATLPTLLVAWELMGATSYALIGFRWQQPARVGAGLTAFLTTRAADLGLYLAAGAAVAGGAGLRLDELPAATGPEVHVMAAGVLVAALGKAAQLPFSVWLSAAMQGPSPVSALLHSAAMVAMGGYLLLRVQPLLGAAGWAGPAAAWTGALTALLLGAVAIAQRDLKQLLAASTSAQLGFVVLGAGVGAVAGGTAHLVAHAATKALLFLVAGAWLSALGTKQLGALRGAARRWPLVGACAAVGTLALAGIVPLSLWATKDEVLAGARKESLSLYLVGLAAAALSAGYAGKVLWLVWARLPAEPGYDSEEAGTRRVGALEQAPLAVLAAAAALLGVLALPPAGPALGTALGDTSPVASAAELTVSAVLAVAVVLAVPPLARCLGPAPAVLRAWLGLGRVTDLLVVRPVLGTATVLARFDDQVVARAVTGVAGAGARAAHAAARIDTAALAPAVSGLAAGVRRLGELARRSQTGQLHQYYVQAAVVLAAALALLLAVR